ncbi:hypothetical protein EMIHUDRAFT_433456 [Emiliania huxleyi CCMP1516]|uniref:Superoxide dismutase n=2 Tax=Emiliania huxleyi TaxID=2903 RepID=A0A0D3KV31_EMIH1|nr:hypothetical protein EMIHUDRAFT_433456 [Emiliania huxleyi CCMP1516]EOD39616.1 hypothetical protein EMIHUDRAFT_433456 [Emiliania huxleyi CCMP1516]|eukprot:XP_005792045.1 hypothetical protein EMIHUDRAFT_433456 [Emiliania huxleyi CCMP1516]
MLLSVTRRRAPTALARAGPALLVRGHCQVPCGIFDDPARVAAMKEDAATIRKSMVQIGELVGKDDALSFNQATRWVMTKEAHAGSLMTTLGEYMLAQRVKRELFEKEEEYVEALKAHHAALQAAMKTKQVVDVAACDALDTAIENVAPMYLKA